MKKIIVNADDLGLNAAVSRGIEEAHQNGIVTSATLMSNMPGFEEGLRVARDNPQLGIGIHLNIIRGTPVTPPDDVSALMEGSRFIPGFWRIGRICHDPVYLAEAEIEYRNQIEKVLYSGIRPDHLDFEKHHGIWKPLFRLGNKLANEYGIGIRSYREPLAFAYRNLPFPGIRKFWLALHLHIYQKFFLNRPEVFSPEFFFGQTHIGEINTEYLKALIKNLPQGISELMCHPGYRNEKDEEEAIKAGGNSWINEKREKELEALSNPEIIEILHKSDIRKTNYAKEIYENRQKCTP